MAAANNTDPKTEIDDWMGKLDINQDDQENIIPKSANIHQLISFQSESNKQTMKTLISCVTEALGDQATDELTNKLNEVTKTNDILSKMLQQRNVDATTKMEGSYFDPLRVPICAPPEKIKEGTKEEVSDSALKLVNTFKGDAEDDGENLRVFLRNIFDIAVTNKLSPECTKAILMRKLSGSARKIIDAFVDEFPDTPGKPTLVEIILKLEDRWLVTLSPELANARLNTLKKGPTMSYTQLEGTIAELTTLAARAEVGDKKTWITQRRIDVMKQALSEEDRLLIARENQSRNLHGLGDLKLSQGIDFLMKHHSERKTFNQVNSVMNNPNIYDGDSVLALKEKDKGKNKNKNKDKNKNVDEKDKEKIKEELYQMYDTYNKDKGYHNRGRGKPNRGRYQQNGRGRGQARGGYKGKDNGNQSKKGAPPRKFVTFEMVNVNKYCCLKCNSPSHLFSNVEACVYGKYPLMTRPCDNCHEGGHAANVCVKDKTSNNGGQQKNEQKPIDPRYSQWPETNKAAPELPSNYIFGASKNGLPPSLFPN